jgi:hypothetical protein
MANDALFQALAQAKSLPSHSYRTADAALQIPGDLVSGIQEGYNARNAILQAKYAPQIIMAQRQAALVDSYGKLAQQIGPDRASQLMGPMMQQVGIDPSQFSQPQGNGAPPSGGGGVPYSPTQLTGMGDYGKTTLGNEKTAQEMQLANAPRDPAAYKSAIMQTGLITPEAFDAWSQSNMDQNGQIPAQNADYLEKSLGLKAQGNRAEFYKTQVGVNQMGLLPSQMPPTSTAGAASQVMMAAHQGKSLIANASTPQALALASVDLSRAVQRAAPVAETIGAGNFATSLPTLWSQLQQKITSDPNGPDVPKMRQALYQQFDDLSTAATPFIQNHLEEMEDNGTNSSFGQNWSGIKNRELGMTLPNIPFNANPMTQGAAAPNLGGSQTNPNTATGVPTGGQTNPDDQAAIQWLQANPNDPKAGAVTGLLQSKGVLP